MRTTVAILAASLALGCARGQGGDDDSTDGGLSDRWIGEGGGSKDGAPDGPRTPTLEQNFPPYGLTWTPSGNLGRAGGLTWTYTGIQRGNLQHIYWIVCDDPMTPCGVSLDGPIQMSARWQFSASDSNLAGGKLVFTNMTDVNTDDAGVVPLTGRLTMTIVDGSSMPIPFATVASLGVTARDGKYGAEIKGTGFQVVGLIEVQDASSTWTPYLDYYDNAHSVPADASTAYVSYGGSFYDD